MSLLDTVREFLAEEEWEAEAIEGRALLVPLSGAGGEWACAVEALDDGDRLLVYGLVPDPVPPARLAAMADFLTRANSGLPVGNFELDHADGEVRFKTSIDVAGDRLSVALVRNLFYSNAAVMDRYLPGVRAVAGGEAPMAAIRAVEG